MTPRPPRASLTSREREVLDRIDAFMRERGASPRVQDLGRALGVGSGVVARHLRALERKGRINPWVGAEYDPEVTCEAGREKRASARASAARRAAAGGPILSAVDPPRAVRLDPRLFGIDDGPHFVLNVTGDGMEEAGIRDGDTVILRRQDAVEDGDIVAAVVEGRAMLRRLYREKARIRLEPAGRSRKPTFAESVTVLGVVKGVVRAVR